MAALDSITTVLVTIVTVLFSAGAWKFYETRVHIKAKAAQKEKDERNMYRDDLRERVNRLEELRQESLKEKDEMRNQILLLTQEVSELRVKVAYLEKENKRLKSS
jgi:primase-polymerase (primpol)-like protein